MKIIGIIGGISWVSTVDYYRYINLGINEQLGGLNYAQCTIYSFNYADIKRNNDANDWDATLQLMITACNHLQQSGAEAIVLGANTMHLIADRLQPHLKIPIIHIATATAEAIVKKGLQTVALLGTKFTMERDFFTERLQQKNINVLIPGDDDRQFLHYTIFEELGRGILKPETRQRYLQMIESLIAQGAEGIILGCTEIPLLINADDVHVPVFDTTLIHAQAAVAFALSE